MGKGSCTRAGLTPIPFEKKRIERKRKELEEREEVEGASKSFLDVLFIKFHSCFYVATENICDKNKLVM